MTIIKRLWARMHGEMTILAEDETGDVPGWVLVTLMSAALVFIIWTLAGPALSGLFQQAIDSVTGIGG